MLGTRKVTKKIAVVEAKETLVSDQIEDSENQSSDNGANDFNENDLDSDFEE